MENPHLTPEANKAVDKIMKLLALSRGNSNENEAASALDAAMRIAEAYNLDMALVERSAKDGAKSGHVRREDQRTGGGLYKWQRTVWEQVAQLNFCRYFAIKGLNAGSKYENRMVGSPVNVVSATVMAEYLVDTIERLAAQWVKDTYPAGTSRFISDAIKYREGMADRIGHRLQDMRWKRQEEEEAKAKAEAAERAKHPDNTGTAIVLKEIVQNEEDLNNDFLQGLEPGTHAKWRHEREMRRANAEARAAEVLRLRDEQEANDPSLKEARLAQEAKDKAKADKEWAEYLKRHSRKSYTYRETAEDRRRSSWAYQDGYRDGSNVGLDRQVTQGSNAKRLK